MASEKTLTRVTVRKAIVSISCRICLTPHASYNHRSGVASEKCLSVCNIR